MTVVQLSNDASLPFCCKKDKYFIFLPVNYRLSSINSFSPNGKALISALPNIKFSEVLKRIVASLFYCVALQGAISAQIIPSPDHVVVVIYENHAYEQIIGSPDAPYINSLATDPYAALFSQSYGVTHPSQPNYMYLFSGDNQNVILDFTPLSFLLPFSTPNLGAELLQNGKTFKGFSEDLPYTGFTGDSVNGYKRKHSPWINWQDGTTNGIPAALNLPLDSFPTDFNQLPNVSFVIPTLDHDMHDGSIAVGDAWLQTHLDAYAQWCKTHNSLLIFTYDEDDDFHSNRIPTFFLGQMVKHGEYTEHIDHNNVLHVMEDMYGLPHAGNSNGAATISDCWLQKPECAFTANTTSICQGQSVQFNDNTTEQPTNWTWLFPGGNPVISYEQNPTVTYNSAGTFPVSLFARNHVGADTLGVLNYITVTPGPAIQLSADSLAICRGESVSLTVTGATGYTWQAAPGIISAQGNSLQAVPVNSVYYQVVGTDGTCISDTAKTWVTVHQQGNTQLQGDICTGETYPFKGLQLNTSGTYRDTLSTIYGCDSFVTLSLQVHVPTISVVNDIMCSGSTYYFNGMDISTPGVYHDTLSSQTGCDSFITLLLAAHNVPAVTWGGAPYSVTQGDNPIALTGGLPANGVYSGAGVGNNTFYPDSVLPGTYTLTYTYTDSLGCSAEAVKTVEVLPLGLNEPSVQNALIIYPNPVAETLHVVMNDETLKVTVYDIHGQRLTVDAVFANEQWNLNTSGWPAGVYLLQCINAHGSYYSNRFVKLSTYNR